mgnify:CR=1 FL=1
MKFTYLEYERLIYFLLDNGYTVTGYDNYRHVEYPVILRHDIDKSLDKAVKMAELENSIGEPFEIGDINSIWYPSFLPNTIQILLS